MMAGAKGARSMRQALDDVRVIELSEGVTGGYCGKLFADLGATVLKIERPGGDPLRQPTDADGPAIAGAFLHLNTNKRTVTLPTDPSAAADLWALLADADLVIETPAGRAPLFSGASAGGSSTSANGAPSWSASAASAQTARTPTMRPAT